MSRSRIIICRHAESIEDVDNTIYDVLSDLEIPLTVRGIKQAESFGLILAELLKDNKIIRFYTSPGVRNVQTLKIVREKLPVDMGVVIFQEPLIVKQDWGNITAENRPSIEADRYRIGVLRYTFPTGESAASMISRLTAFWNKISALQSKTDEDVVIFSHGFEFRVFLKIILGWEEEVFESFGNLGNCEYRILTRLEDGRYDLNKPLRMHGLPITRLKNS